MHGESAPSRVDEYHFYQALIAIWPAEAERLKTYMLKAAREAKLRTSWINPDGDYEAALERFVTESLANALFQKELAEAMPRIAHLGFLVSLSQALLKVASPGVPDYYQGTELIDLSLVDPDNRRPIDFGARHRLLAELGKGARQPAALLADLADGRAKLHVIRQGLADREEPAWDFGSVDGMATCAALGTVAKAAAEEVAADAAHVLAWDADRTPAGRSPWARRPGCRGRPYAPGRPCSAARSTWLPPSSSPTSSRPGWCWGGPTTVW